MAYNNVVKPTSLFNTFPKTVTLPVGGVTHMDTNLKGELALMNTII